MINGMNRCNGKMLKGVDHLRQSITDILTTPKGSRVMRRDYGSDLFQWIDAPVNSSTMIHIYAATADALQKWEPRFRLDQVKLNEINADGKIILTLTGTYLPDGSEVKMENLIL